MFLRDCSGEGFVFGVELMGGVAFWGTFRLMTKLEHEVGGILR